MKLFDAADAVRKLVTTPDDLGPCQQYCEALKAEVRRLRHLIQTALNSPCVMGADDIDTLAAALEDDGEYTPEGPRIRQTACEVVGGDDAV